ncbi:hypothetical protein L9F63_013036, partial [Diploptera punctata]
LLKITVKTSTMTAWGKLSSESGYVIYDWINNNMHLVLGFSVFNSRSGHSWSSHTFAFAQTTGRYELIMPSTDVYCIFCLFPIYLRNWAQTYLHMMVLLKFLSYYAIPLCIIAFFYILMARHLELSTRNMPGEMQGQSTQIRARKKVAKMVLAFVIIFILCFLPYHHLHVVVSLYPEAHDLYDDFWHAFRIIGF